MICCICLHHISRTLVQPPCSDGSFADVMRLQSALASDLKLRRQMATTAGLGEVNQLKQSDCTLHQFIEEPRRNL